MRQGWIREDLLVSRRNPSCLLVTVCLLVLTSGCQASEINQIKTPAPVARMQKPEIKPVSHESSNLPSPPPNALSVRVVARVNDMPILDEEIRNTTAPYELQLANVQEPTRSEKLREIRKAALNKIIERELVLSDLHERIGKNRPLYLEKLNGIARKEFNKQLKTIKQNIEKQLGKPVESDDQLREILGSQGVTLEGYQRQIEREFMSMEYLRARIFPAVKASVGHKEIVEYYEQHAQEFETVDMVHWQHIFIDESKYRDRDSARKLARTIAQQAANGADFMKLIANFDNGDSAWLGEDHKHSERGQVQPAVLEPILFRMKTGQVGPIIEAQHGFHVFKLVEREYAGRKPLTQEIQSEIRRKLQNDAATHETRRFMDELKARAAIEILIEDF